jgi:capsular exopolysaccharide synthesis family protein
MVDPVEEAAAPASPFHIQRLFTFLVKFWWVSLVTLVIGLGVAVIIVRWQPPTYVSKGSMSQTVKLRLREADMFAEDVQAFLGTQTDLLQSDTLRQQALTKLRTAGSNIPRGDDGEPMLVDIRVVGSSKSSVFRLEASSANAAYAQTYLDALMDVYLEFKRNDRKVASGGALASVSDIVDRTERDLKAAKARLTEFNKTNGLANVEEYARTYSAYLARLQTQLSDLQFEARLLGTPASNPPPAAVTGQTNAASGLVEAPITPQSLPLAGAPLEQQSASKEVALLRMQREKLSRYLRPKHPRIVKLDADLQRAEKLLEIYQLQNQDQLNATRKNLELKIQNTIVAIREWESKVEAASTLVARAEELRYEVQSQQPLYERLVQLLEDVKISRNIDQETLAILQRAGPPRRTYTREMGTLSMGGFGGVCLGLGFVLLLMVRDDRFTSLTEVNEKLGEMIVGQVPELEDVKPDVTPALLEMDDPRHAYAESFRSLRSALIFMSTAQVERPHVVLVTSAVPNEGKSTVAANLARTLALGGARVVLVDADLRRGILHQLMELQPSPGLGEVLVEPARLDTAIQTNSLPNFSFLSSGNSPSHSGDALLGTTFDTVLSRLRQQFDYVVIDSSPVFAADDASTLAPKVDGVLFVVRSRFSRAGPAREALGLLYQRNARVLGVIFNQADTSARNNYYYKYADYYRSAKST